MGEHVLQKYHIRLWRWLVCCEAGRKPGPMRRSPMWPQRQPVHFLLEEYFNFFVLHNSFLNKYNHYKHIWSLVSWLAARGFPQRCFLHDGPLNTRLAVHTPVHTHVSPPQPPCRHALYEYEERNTLSTETTKTLLSSLLLSCSYICPVKYCTPSMQPGGD